MMMKRRIRIPSYLALFAAMLLAVATTGASGYGMKAHSDTASCDDATHAMDIVNGAGSQAPMS